MRRTNSKEAMEAIKNAIMESYEAAEENITHMTTRKQRQTTTTYAKTF